MIRVMPAVVRGPLAVEVQQWLPVWLADEGYSSTTVPQVLAVARGLSGWMDDHDVGLDVLCVEVFEAFCADYGQGTAGHAIVGMRVPVVRRFLIERGYLHGVRVGPKRARPPAGKRVPVVCAAAKGELDEWARWQREVRGISLGCIAHRRIWVEGLVESLCSSGTVEWSTCDLGVVNSFIVARSVGFSPASRSTLVDATRALLRWALTTGRVRHDLSGGILRVRGTRATLPRGLSLAQVESLIAACNPATMVGVRDRAVITVLWRLGLRAGEAAGLSLDDLDWGAGRLTVVGKGQRRLTLPIPVDVGEVLVAWLQLRPRDAADRAVFIRLRAPRCGLSSAGISDIVKHRAESAGLGTIHAHRLRHTAAMNVIAAGGTLIEAQEMLGHQNSGSTKVYARTDVDSLRALTVPFGRVPG